MLRLAGAIADGVWLNFAPADAIGEMLIHPFYGGWLIPVALEKIAGPNPEARLAVDFRGGFDAPHGLAM